MQSIEQKLADLCAQAIQMEPEQIEEVFKRNGIEANSDVIDLIKASPEDAPDIHSWMIGLCQGMLSVLIMKEQRDV